MKHLIKYCDFKLNENVSVESYQNTVKKVINNLKLNLLMISSYGLSYLSFYPFVDQLIKNQDNINLSRELVVIVSLCALSIFLHENIEQIDKLKSYAKEKGVIVLVNKILDILNGIKNIYPILMTEISKEDKKNITSMNIFSNTSLFLPFINSLLELIKKYNIKPDDLVKFLKNIPNNLITELINMIKDKIKKPNSVKEYNSIFR